MGTVLDTIEYAYGNTNWGDMLTGYGDNTIRNLIFSGNPYTFTYTKSSNVPLVYHYVLNLQGDVVRLVTDDGITFVTNS